MNTTPETPAKPAAEATLGELIAAGKVASKKGRKAKRRTLKRRRQHRMTSAMRAEQAARHAFWQWEELYKHALNSLIASLATGRRMTPDALVKYAVSVADKGMAVCAKRRPADE